MSNAVSCSTASLTADNQPGSLEVHTILPMANNFKRVRPTAMAGRFYPEDTHQCAQQISELAESPIPGIRPDLPAKLSGAIVPHAGWVCSGSVAIHTLKTLAQRSNARTMFLTGTVHTMAMNGPTLDSADAWQTPLGDIAVDNQLRQAISLLPEVSTLDMAHQYEHSLEVVLPMISDAFGEDVKVVPCLIPPHPNAHQWGKQLGQLIQRWPHPVAVVISTDLTHYGPNYNYQPHGSGEEGRQWAFETNDQRVLDLISAMDSQQIVPEVQQYHNACGPGAIAAGMEIMRQLGSTRGYLLEHTDSTAQLEPLGKADPDNSVGYAGVVFG